MASVFFSAFFLRYFRLVINGVAFMTMLPIAIPVYPTVDPAHVTVVVPTNAKGLPELMACLTSILTCSPAGLIVFTKFTRVKKIKQCCKNHDTDLDRLQIIGVDRLNKRSQVVAALRNVTTSITVFADDDVIWPNQYLRYLLVCFRIQGSVQQERDREFSDIRRGRSSIFWAHRISNGAIS